MKFFLAFLLIIPNVLASTKGMESSKGMEMSAKGKGSKGMDSSKGMEMKKMRMGMADGKGMKMMSSKGGDMSKGMDMSKGSKGMGMSSKGSKGMGMSSKGSKGMDMSSKGGMGKGMMMAKGSKGSKGMDGGECPPTECPAPECFADMDECMQRIITVRNIFLLESFNDITNITTDLLEELAAPELTLEEVFAMGLAHMEERMGVTNDFMDIGGGTMVNSQGFVWIPFKAALGSWVQSDTNYADPCFEGSTEPHPNELAGMLFQKIDDSPADYGGTFAAETCAISPCPALQNDYLFGFATMRFADGLRVRFASYTPIRSTELAMQSFYLQGISVEEEPKFATLQGSIQLEFRPDGKIEFFERLMYTVSCDPEGAGERYTLTGELVKP